MLVLTRRPGESVVIADTFELQVLDVDPHGLSVTCAVAANDARDAKLRCVVRPNGTASVSVADEDRHR
jgi:hypothetical protein